MHVKIELEGHGRGQVYIDGEKIDGVRAVKAEACVDEANTVTLELIPTRVEVSGPFDVTDLRSEAREWRVGPGPFPHIDFGKFQRACDRAWFGLRC